MAESGTATISFNLSCTICTEVYKSNEEVLSTNCGHVSHKTCYQEWMRRSQTCPECRSENPQTQPLYLHIEDPTEAENRNQRSQLDLVPKVSILERRLEESDQNFFNAQCALALANEQMDELKQQLEYSKVLNLSYEQAQIQTRASLSEAKHALELRNKQLDELNVKLNCVQQMKRDLELSKEQVSKLNEELDFKNAKISNYDKAFEILKLRNEQQIEDLSQQHAAAEKVSESFKAHLQEQLEASEDLVAKLQQDLNALQNRRQNKNPSQHIVEGFKDSKMENALNAITRAKIFLQKDNK